MTSNSEELERIYEFAKENRIALTQDEFAKMLGFRSRSHLFGRIVKSKEGVSNGLLNKAKNVFYNTTKNVPHEKGNIPLNIKSNSDPPQELIEEIKKLKTDLENKEKTINNLNISLDELRGKYNELKNAHPQRKTGTEG